MNTENKRHENKKKGKQKGKVREEKKAEGRRHEGCPAALPLQCLP